MNRTSGWFRGLAERHGSLACVLVLTAVAAVRGEEAKEIVRRADDKARGKTLQAEVSIQVIRPDWTREMALKLWSEGKDKALAVVTAPAREKGTAFLRRKREVWNWIPSVERTVKLPPSMMSQSWMGTDITNEDFVREASIVEDYSHSLVGEDTVLGRPSWMIDLTPKPGSPVVWGRIRAWIDKVDHLQLRSEFYDEENALVNTMVASEIKPMGGRLLPSHLEVIPADKPGHKTVAVYRSMVFDKPIPEETFTVRRLTTLK